MSKFILERKSGILHLVMVCTSGMILFLGLLWFMMAVSTSYAARTEAITVHYVAPGGSDNNNDCRNYKLPCATIQRAVDMAMTGDEIRVAGGVYSDVHSRPRADVEATGTVIQVVYINKTLTIRGGYNATDWDSSDPVAQPTTLDAQGQGRVLYITGAISPTIEGIQLMGGDAAGLGGSPSTLDAGGGVYAFASTISINNSQIFSNTATTGGGFYVQDGQDVTLTGSSVFENIGWYSAGGILLRDSPGAIFKANTIHDNIANHLGAGQKHHGGALFLFSPNAMLIDNVVRDNGASDSCGGLSFSVSDNATLIGNSVIGNGSGSPGFGSSAFGGGICISDSDGVTMRRNLISGNKAYGNGGGLYLARSDISMINNVIADNEILASSNFVGSGNGLYISGASPQMTHTTIARNSGGDNSGVFINDFTGTFSQVVMTDTIVTGHVTGLNVTANNMATLNGVLWHSNGLDAGGAGTISVTNGSSGDPHFAADGYHLTAASAAIDKGVSTAIDDDIDGQPRPCGSAADLGADEYCFTSYLPVFAND